MRGDKGARMANAMAVVAGRGSRPCDVCARKRSRWYCAADEAYLCQACDSSVHAANALAFRHERVPLTPSGAPMKTERRNVNHGEHPSAPNNKKKLKNLRPAPNPCGDPISGSTAFKSPQQQLHNSGLREVKLELHLPNYTINDADHDGSDDHFTAEELTGNANVLDETLPSMCPPSYDGSNNPDRSSHVLTNRGERQDFAHDFLVSDPNDSNNNYGTGIRGSGTIDANTSSAGGGEGVEEGVGDDQDEDDAEDGAVENEWMDGLDLANRDLSDDDEYCIDPSALRDSVSGGASDQSVALYSHDEKPVLVSCGIPSSSSQMGKAFKNMAGQQEWVKVEEGYPNYGVAPQQALANSSACKIEGLSMSDSDLRQVPSLRLNYEDVLSSWSDRSFRCTDDGSGSQLVPGDDTNSDLGSCYDLGLVPDLSNGGGGIDGGSGQFPHIYGGCGPGGGGAGGAGDDGGANVGNAREFKVNRYREKRRTRKFSKKIRYEVRKVNAERRPRMKGRFVKRSPSRET